MTPHRPALIVHTFLPVDGAGTRAALEALWRKVHNLAMDQSIGALSQDLPEDLPADREPLVVFAARRRIAAGAFYEALAYRVHDVIAVSVLQAPNDIATDWTALDAEWTGTEPPAPHGPMEAVRVYLGQWPARRLFGRAPRSAAGRARLVARRVPDAGGVDWSAAWCRAANGLLLWELPALPESSAPADRRLLTMGDIHDERVMDRWTWFSEGLVLPPLTRYLLHAAKLRHQRAVLEAALPRLRAARRRTEDGCDTLATLLRADDPPVHDVLAARQSLGVVQTERGGLIAAWADANDMAQTVRVARINMTSALDAAPRCQPTGPIEVDQEIATWMTDQLTTELTYLDSAQRKADELGRLAAATIEQRQRRRQESLALLQTAVLGALLMALAAIQSLGYKVPLAGPLMAPLIALLATLALVLPAAALRWPDRSRPQRLTHLWYVTAAGGLGASVGWLAVSTVWRAAAGTPAPAIWSLAGGAAAAVIAGIAAAALLRAGRRGRTTPSGGHGAQAPEPL